MYFLGIETSCDETAAAVFTDAPVVLSSVIASQTDLHARFGGVVPEVADSSLAHDRRDKGRAYAKAGLAVYWIINLVDSQVEVYTDPSGPGPAPAYGERHDYGINDAVPCAIEGQPIGPIPVRDLLP